MSGPRLDPNKSKPLSGNDIWIDGFNKLAMDLMHMYAKAPDATENLLMNGYSLKVVYGSIYNLYVSRGIITAIEKLDLDNKNYLWQKVKSLEKKYRKEPLPLVDGIKISKSLYVLEYLCGTYLEK